MSRCPRAPGPGHPSALARAGGWSLRLRLEFSTKSPGTLPRAPRTPGPARRCCHRRCWPRARPPAAPAGSPPRPKPNIHVMSRKVTEHHDYTGFASNVTPVGDFALRSGDTKSPWIQDRFPVRAAVFAGFFSPFDSSAKSRLLLCGWCRERWVRAWLGFAVGSARRVSPGISG